MPDDPQGPELLDAVGRLLREQLIPQLAPAAAFHALVAAHAVDTAAREQRLGPAAEAAACERLRLLLQCNAGDAAALETELVRRIAGGALAIDDPALLAHLWATTLDKLAIDQPGYAPYRRELQRRAT